MTKAAWRGSPVTLCFPCSLALPTLFVVFSVSVFSSHLLIKQLAFSQWLFTISAGKSHLIFGSVPLVRMSPNACANHPETLLPCLACLLGSWITWHDLIAAAHLAWPGWLSPEVSPQGSRLCRFCPDLPASIGLEMRAAASCSHGWGRHRSAMNMEWSPLGRRAADGAPTGTSLQNLLCYWTKHWRIYGAKRAPGKRLNQNLPPLTFMKHLNQQSTSSQLKFLTCLLNNCKVEGF